MLKLLLVDDEEIICNSIANLIDWESIGIQVIGTCLDGVEAYYTILDEAPDIVMTDIRMPGISGLELIERIFRTNLNTSFIILSGHGEFEYAKTAMKYGIRDYLLKPCDEFQVMDCMKRVIEDHNKMTLQSNANPTENPISQQLQETLIYNIVREGISVPALDQNFFHSYSNYLNLTNTPYQLYRLYYLEKKNLESCLHAIREYFSSNIPGLAAYKIYVSNTLLIFFPDYEVEYKQLDHFLENLSLPLQSTSCTYERIPYPDLRTLLNVQIPKLKRFDILYFDEHERINANYNYNHVTLQMNHLIQELTDKDKDLTDTLSEIRNILETISDRDFMIQLVNNLLISLNIKLSENSLSVITDLLIEIRHMNSSEEIISAALKRVLSLLNEQHDSNHYSLFIEKLIQYTQDHLSDQNLTLKYISENYLYMNVNYVSRRFYQETNQKYSSYLMNLRIQRAKDILAKDNSVKIQDIAEMVGCGNNPNYFSRIFKKCTGITPSAYIARLLP